MTYAREKSIKVNLFRRILSVFQGHLAQSPSQRKSKAKNKSIIYKIAKDACNRS